MTNTNLIEALQEECRTDRIKVEDFLNAFGDLCADTLKKGEAFRVRSVGSFILTRRLSPKSNKILTSIVFQPSDSLRKRLGFPDDEPIRKQRGLCRECGLRPGKVRIYDECGECLDAKSLAKRKR